MDACTISHQEVGQINTAALEILMQSNTPFILIDAREAPWDDGRRIPGAISITSGPIHELIPEKGALIVLYCSHQQCGASGRLAKRLAELGYCFVLKYPEGIDGWIHSGRPV